MGCIIYNYDYTREMENKNYSITIISNIYINEISDKNKNSTQLNDNLRIINNYSISQSKNTNININKNVNNVVGNNPFPFVKIELKVNKSHI